MTVWQNSGHSQRLRNSASVYTTELQANFHCLKPILSTSHYNRTHITGCIFGNITCNRRHQSVILHRFSLTERILIDSYLILLVLSRLPRENSKSPHLVNMRPFKKCSFPQENRRGEFGSSRSTWRMLRKCPESWRHPEGTLTCGIWSFVLQQWRWKIKTPKEQRMCARDIGMRNSRDKFSRSG